MRSSADLQKEKICLMNVLVYSSPAGILLLGLFSRKYVITNARIKLYMLFAAILLASSCFSVFVDYIEVKHPTQLGCDAK